MKTFYVIYRGVGRDGGFGDYAGADWDDEPVKMNNDILWLNNEKDAQDTVTILNYKSEEDFFAAGHGEAYTGEFSIEYQYRKIEVPDSQPITSRRAVELITKQDAKHWPDGDFYEED